jgi:uncharacterized protein YggE
VRFFFAIALVVAAACSFGQDIQVNRQNKTIAVTAEESASADAEVATLAIGYHNYGLTQDSAFKDNIQMSERIIKAILSAGVPKTNVETEKLQLDRVQIEDKWTPDMKKERQFEAVQSWHMAVSAAQAQKVADLAVKAGANQVDDVDWNVSDPVALQAKAGAAALAKARSIADQMAKGLGTKLGELVYASNRAPVVKMWRGVTLNTSSATVEVNAEKQPQLTLFPERVKSDATVYAVFSIE